jgi:replication factor C large subunit
MEKIWMGNYITFVLPNFPMPFTPTKPTSVSQLIGNPTAFEEVKKWAREWQEREAKSAAAQEKPSSAEGKASAAKTAPPKPLLVYGATGIGKTALAYALASEFGWELFEFNASDLRDEETVTKLLSNAASQGGLFGHRRLILIDDVDSLSGREDRGGAGAIAKVLASFQQPIILTAHDYYDRKIQTIRNYCIPIPLRRPTATAINSLLKRAANERNAAAAKSGASPAFTVSEEMLAKISAASSGDVRAALNDLAAGNVSAFRDSEKNIFDVVRTILKSEKYSEARRAALDSEVEHDTLKLWVAHNIPIEYEKPFDIAEAYNSLSRADIYDGRIHRRQYWGFLRYSGDLLSAGVSVVKAAPYRKFSQLSFPDYLREMGASKGSRAMRKAVLQKISRACHCSLQQSAFYLPLLSLLAKKDTAAVSDFFKFDEDELAFVSGKKPAAEKKARKKKGTS